MLEKLMLVVVSMLSATTVGGQSLNEQRGSVGQDTRSIEQRAAEIQSQYEALQSDLDALNNRASQIRTSNADLDAMQKVLNEQIREFNGKWANQRNRLYAENQMLVGETKSLDSAIRENNREHDSIDAARRVLDRTSQFEVSRYNARANKFNAELRRLKQRAAVLDAERTAFIRETKRAADDFNKLRSDLEDKLQALSAARAKNHAAETEFAQRKSTLDSRRNELVSARRSLDADRKRLEDTARGSNPDPGVVKPGPRLDYDDDAPGKHGDPTGATRNGETSHDELRHAKESARRAQEERNALEHDSGR